MARSKAQQADPQQGNPAGRERIRAHLAPLMPCPEGLDVLDFAVGGEQYALLSFPLPPGGLPGGLTEAEWQVVVLVLAGQSNAGIAAARGVSTRTVANQVASVFRKLGLSSRTELAAWWISMAL